MDYWERISFWFILAAEENGSVFGLFEHGESFGAFCDGIEALFRGDLRFDFGAGFLELCFEVEELDEFFDGLVFFFDVEGEADGWEAVEDVDGDEKETVEAGFEDELVEFVLSVSGDFPWEFRENFRENGGVDAGAGIGVSDIFDEVVVDAGEVEVETDAEGALNEVVGCGLVAGELGLCFEVVVVCEHLARVSQKVRHDRIVSLRAENQLCHWFLECQQLIPQITYVLFVHNPRVVNVVRFLAQVRVNRQNVFSVQLHHHKILKIWLYQNVEHQNYQNVHNEKKTYHRHDHQL